MQGPGESRREDPKLIDPMPDKPAEQRFSMRRYVHDDVTSVSLGAFPPKKPALFHAVHQFDGAVMLDLQPFSETADGWFLIGGQPAQCQQTHVLLRLEPNRPGGLFGVIDVPPYEKTKLGERAVFGSACGVSHPRYYIAERGLYRIAIRSYVRNSESCYF